MENEEKQAAPASEPAQAQDRKEIQAKADEKRKNWRARAWQCVVYPESAAEDWQEKLHAQGVPYDISPLHDKDIKPDGTLKKPHWHVILDWGAGATVSGDRAIEVFDIIGGVYPDPEKDRREFLAACKVKKLLSAQRYLCHLDEHDPSKHHYPVEEVKSGFQELPFVERTLKTMEKDALAMAMVAYCVEHDLYTFDEFVLAAMRDHPEWMHAVINERAGTFVNRFLNGRMANRRDKREEEKHESLMAIRRGRLPEKEKPLGGDGGEQTDGGDAADGEARVECPEGAHYDYARDTSNFHPCPSSTPPCLGCGAADTYPYGKTPDGEQRYICAACGSVFVPID